MKSFFITMIIYSFYDIMVVALAQRAAETTSQVDDKFVRVLSEEKESIIKDIMKKI